MRRGVLTIVIAIPLVLAGCEEGTPVAGLGIATLPELTGPWRPQPLVLDPGLRDRIAQTCRRDMERGPGSVVGVIDARGMGVAVVRMTGPDAGTCDALQITADGQVAGAGGGWRADGVEQLAPPGDAQIVDIQTGQVGGGDLRIQGWSVMGRAGGAITSVVVETPGQPQILASLEGGWFAAWWPGAIPNPNGGGPLPAPRCIVRGYDGLGAQVAEASC